MQAAAAADAALKGLSLTVLDSEEALRTKVLQAGQIVLTTPGQLAKVCISPTTRAPAPHTMSQQCITMSSTSACTSHGPRSPCCTLGIADPVM